MASRDSVIGARLAWWLAGFGALLAGCGGGDGMPGGGGDGGSGSTCGMTASEVRVVEIVNEERAEAGADPLACDGVLAEAAKLHTRDMCDQGYFSHTGMDGSSYSERVQRIDSSYWGAGGENIARGQTSASQVMRTWMQSSGHRANILNQRYSIIGVGHVPCAGRHYWTQVFWN